MNASAFALLRRAESSWWYQARIRMIQRVMRERHPFGRVLDVGSGFGGMKEPLSEYGSVFGVEPNAEAAAICRERGYQGAFASMNEVGASGEVFNVVGAFDSLEHVEDAGEMLDRIRSVMASDGVLLVTVPAYPMLWSSHDVAHQHFRRYTASTLRMALEQHGFDIVYMSYWNCFLFPLFFVARILGIGGEGSLSSGWMDAVFSFILRTESKLVPRFRLPFGSSIIALAVLR